MNGPITVSADAIIEQYQQKLTDANYENVMLRVRLDVLERKLSGLEAQLPAPVLPPPTYVTDVAAPE